MHKSISIYAKAIGRTEGQIRRYIRQKKIPSARLIRSQVGRPSWSIDDCSPEAIADLKGKLQMERWLRRPVIFHEPFKERMITEVPDGKPILSVGIIWRRMWHPRHWDGVAAAHDIITRVVLLTEGLSWDDLHDPPVIRDGWLVRIEPAHQEKIKAFRQKRRQWLRKWIDPCSATDHEEIQKLFGDVNRTIIIEAAQFLAVYQRRYDIPITYRTLARVLGISKSALYRRYRRELIKDALRHARSLATSPTQGTICTRNELE